MFYDPVRKALIDCRHAILASLAQRTCAHDLNALGTIDGLLLAESREIVGANAKNPIGIHFTDAPAETMPAPEADDSYAALVAKLEALKLQRIQDSKIIDGLRAKLEGKK